MWTLFGLGFVAASCLWLGLVWIPRRVAPVEALRAFAAAHGQPVRGDGRAQPLTILGQVRGRLFTVSWQRPWVGGDVLLLGVDCAAPDGKGLDGTATDDGVLVTRWVRPAPDVLAPERLVAILDSLARMAEEMEADTPDRPADMEHG